MTFLIIFKIDLYKFATVQCLITCLLNDLWLYAVSKGFVSAP